MIWLSVTLIAACAILWDVGIVLQKLAVGEIPQIGLGRQLGPSLRAILRSKRWMGGFLASVAGWGLFAAALSFTPVSLARTIQGSGFVLLAVFSLLFLRHRLKLLEWAGVILVTAGIICLGLASTSTGPTQPHGAPLAIAVVCCLIVCAAAASLQRLPRALIAPVLSFSITAGILLGLGDVSTKLLLDEIGPGGTLLAAFAIGAPALVVFYIAGFITLSRAYQHGRAILVTAASDFCSRLVAVILGVSALGESLAAAPRLRLAEIAGYAAVLIGALLLARYSGEELAGDLRAAASPPAP